MEKKIKATAKVQVTFEFELTQPWGGECPIAQLYDQATREARERAMRAIAAGMPASRLVGEPKVMGIITEAG